MECRFVFQLDVEIVDTMYRWNVVFLKVRYENCWIQCINGV